MLSLTTLIILGVVAFFVAFFAILAGFGGGILLVPILTLFFGLPLKLVIGSVIISLWVPALIGAIGAFRRGEVDVRLGLLFELPTSIGAFLGAKSTTFLPDYLIQLVFGSIAFFLSFQMLQKARRLQQDLPMNRSPFWAFVGSIPPVVVFHSKYDDEYHVSLPSLMLAGLIIGFLAGMLGVGGGWIKTPLLILGFGIPPIIATGTAIFMIFITSIVGGVTHFFDGNVDFTLSIAIMIGLGIGALLGNYSKPKFKAYQITYIIAIILFLVSLIMLYQAFIILP